MKYYTVEETAKKLKVSEGHIYKLVKLGEIKKKDGMGRTIRIPEKELSKVSTKKNYFTYDKNKVELISTYIGEVRKVKGKDEYVLTDISKAIGLKDSYSVTRRLDEKLLRKIEVAEAQNLGLFVKQFGLILISYKGIKEYCKKCRSDIDFERFLEELHVEDEQLHIEEAVPMLNMKLFEGTPVEIIIDENEEPLFELYSTGMALGHTKTDGKSISVNGGQKLYPRKDRIEAVLQRLEITAVVKDGQQYLTEQMLYDFMLETRSAQCIPFRRWVTSEVLPTIRKTGGYVQSTEKFTENYFSNLSEDVRNTIKNELESKNNELLIARTKVEQQLEANSKIINLINEA